MTTRRCSTLLLEARADSPWPTSTCSLFHQANLRINEYIANQVGIPAEKMLSNIQRYGNTTAATIPLLLDEAARDGRLKKGSKVACVAFGSGFTWGSALIDW